MAFTAIYDATLSRIRLAASALGATATTATFDRTTDGVRYTTVRGGSAVVVAALAASVDDYEFIPGVANTYRLRSYTAGGVLLATATAVITQDLTSAWLKIPAAPFLNRAVTPSVRIVTSRKSRGGVFDVVGRSFPVAVGDVRGSREFTLKLRTASSSDERDLDYAFATGEVIFLQAPAAQDQFPTGYFAVGDIQRAPESRYSEVRVWDLPLTEVAAPGPDVVGSSYTCASVLFEYATVADMLAGNATIGDLLNRTGTPAEVIVP